ncbi:hypothetical protein DL768_010541 [Monosporascus sp. mg162]|nr:hypothetical protein DL768_010541 [Monosporascus sp. mg162]
MNILGRQALVLWAFWTFAMPLVSATTAQLRNIVYFCGQHPTVPKSLLTSQITHVVMAFMNSDIFNREEPSSDWPLFMTVKETRAQFAPDTKIMVAIGGWGDTAGFSLASATEGCRQRWARNVAAMLRDTGADGVDIDWEYPGGNGEDYKQVPNEHKAWEIGAYPLLLAEIRTAIGPDKLISVAVPGLPRDMLPFTAEMLPTIMESVDFLNVMTYEMMNRRDTITKHHAGKVASRESLKNYIKNGVRPGNLNLGFAFYTKFYRTEHHTCLQSPIGCSTLLMEDPKTGVDMGRTGAFAWADEVPAEMQASLSKALHDGQYDNIGGGYYYWDVDQDLWWSHETPGSIEDKFGLVRELGLGGVFAWELGADGPEYSRLAALNAAVGGSRGKKDEL